MGYSVCHPTWECKAGGSKECNLLCGLSMSLKNSLHSVSVLHSVSLTQPPVVPPGRTYLGEQTMRALYCVTSSWS